MSHVGLVPLESVHIHRRAPSSQPQGRGRTGRREVAREATKARTRHPGCLRSRRPPSRLENNVSSNSKHWGLEWLSGGWHLTKP